MYRKQKQLSTQTKKPRLYSDITSSRIRGIKGDICNRSFQAIRHMPQRTCRTHSILFYVSSHHCSGYTYWIIKCFVKAIRHPGPISMFWNITIAIHFHITELCLTYYHSYTIIRIYLRLGNGIRCLCHHSTCVSLNLHTEKTHYTRCCSTV